MKIHRVCTNLVRFYMKIHHICVNLVYLVEKWFKMYVNSVGWRHLTSVLAD